MVKGLHQKIELFWYLMTFHKYVIAPIIVSCLVHSAYLQSDDIIITYHTNTTIQMFLMA